MSTTYDWPEDFAVAGFSLRLRRNTRTFTSPYSGTGQTVEFGGERWVAELTLPAAGRYTTTGQRRESLTNKLSGGFNRVRLWHFFNPTAGGTFKDAPVPFAWTRSGSPFTWTRSGAAFSWTVGTLALLGSELAGASTCVLQSIAGRTVTEGSMVSINGQLVQIMANATADSSGRLALSFAPRVREAWPAYSAPIVTTRPTAPFRLAGEVPTPWSPGQVGGAGFELVEDINP